MKARKYEYDQKVRSSPSDGVGGNFVLICRFCEVTGYTEKAVRRKIEDGVFIEGMHYVKAPDKRIHMNWSGYNGWVNKGSK